MSNYNFDPGYGVGIKHWTKGVEVDEAAMNQLRNISQMPFVFKHVAAMPDVHLGKGATVGSVIATKGAIIPAAVGVDIGCGMVAAKTNLCANQLPDSLKAIRADIEKVIPLGAGGQHKYSPFMGAAWNKTIIEFGERFDKITNKHPKITPKAADKWVLQMGSLGSGNHFIEICLDTSNNVWIMLHSGSRGIGNIIGSYFITKAKEEMAKMFINLPDRDLAYLVEDTEIFDDYMEGVAWAQEYAAMNRMGMMNLVEKALRRHFPKLSLTTEAINCHHNYVKKENHFGSNVWVTRKGAVQARKGTLGIIPGSMGAKSYIVEGLGNPDSFHSCSHGAGRVMSRGEAKRRITMDEHRTAMKGIEARLDKDVIDESPAAYKNIDRVMEAQKDLVKIRYTLRQILNVKG